MAPLAFGLSTGCTKCETSPRRGRIMPWVSAEGSEQGIQGASPVPLEIALLAKVFPSPCCRRLHTHTHTRHHIYIMNNSKHALTINQPDNNQLLKCYNIWGRKCCATVVQAASKTTLHACNPCSPKIGTLRVQTNRICHLQAVCKRATTYVAQLFLPLGFFVKHKRTFSC
jgi:hypothetical protein